MKKILLIIGLLVLSSFALAVDIDEVCQEHGFEHGIVKFEWNGNSFVQEGVPLFPYSIEIEDDNMEAFWSSNLYVSGVIVKASIFDEVYDGGFNGTVYDIDVHDISHVTFCKNASNGGGDNGGGDNGVPEFSTGAMALIVVLGSLGIMVLRKN